MKLTFKEFLAEATVKDSVNRKKIIFDKIDSEEKVKELMKLLNKNCKHATDKFFKTNFGIFRGMSDGPEVIQVQYNKGTRTTENTHDYYRMIIDTHPDFQGTDLPKRNKAMIASTSREYATGYGEALYVVFPFDNTIIGVVPQHDIFDLNFKVFDREANVDGISTMINRIFTNARGAGNKKVKVGIITPEIFVKNIDEIGMERVVTSLQNGWSPFIKDEDMGAKEFAKKFGISDGKTFLDYLYKTLSPQNLKFKALLPQNFYSQAPNDKEVWIGDKCILVSAESIGFIKRTLNIK